MPGARRQQRGIVAALVVIGMLAFIAMAGLALDTAHLVLNKSRLQSTVDAAALAAAKTLDETAGSEGEEAAREVVTRIFESNATYQPELLKALSGRVVPVVQFSHTLSPFVDGTTPIEYVRVIADDFPMWTSFTRLVGIEEMTTRASAVAGLSAPIVAPCDLFPVAVCAVPGSSAPYHGYVPYNKPGATVTLLKLASPSSGSTIGPGNFQLICIDEVCGGANLRERMAGGAVCAKPGESQMFEPEPGNKVAEVVQGMNTRFGIYEGPLKGRQDDFKPDQVVKPKCNPDVPNSCPWAVDKDGDITFEGEKIGAGMPPEAYTYEDYDSETVLDYSDGVKGRRVVGIPIVNCETPTPGRSNALDVVGFGCFFLLQPAIKSGSENWIFGEFKSECPGSGSPGQQGGEGIYTIVLHNDPSTPDS